jgi:hypothetical protein
MTKAKDDIVYPYEFIDPQAEYWATHKRKDEDPYASRQWIDNTPNSDPWSNGRYALAALVWGLILMVVFGVGAGP